MDKYNIALIKNEDGSVDLRATMADLRKKMGGLSESEQAAAASAIFGKNSMAGWLAIINASDKDFDKLTGAIDNCDGTALEMAGREEYDLILLDIMLPELNGLEVLRRLKQDGRDIAPVILVTARDAVMDKVSGLDAGAVDYITKPFAIEELLARIRVALKMHSRLTDLEQQSIQASAGPVNTDEKEALAEGEYTWNKLTLNDKKHTVKYDGHEITLTNREFLMLKTLLENKDIVMTRDTLLEKVCGYDYIGETNVVDVYIRFLRSKIDEVYDIKMIQTVRGVGYVIKSE
jgi:DNA-binding response OmpR family regulator